jgi:signal transduction histidine kinase
MRLQRTPVSWRVMGVSTEYLEELLDILPSALISMTPEYRVVWCNRTTAELAPAVKPGSDLFEVLQPAANPEKIDRLLLRGEKVMFRAEPDLPLLEWLVADHELPGGDLILMAWDPDLTDEMVRRRATFAMAAAHELRSPLTALIGFAEMLDIENENLTPAQVEAASIIRQNAYYLENLVNDILDLTSNSFGELRLELESTDVADAISEVSGSLTERITDGGQSIRVDVEAGLPAVEVDRRRLRQVIENLIHNAHVHCPEGTAIDVSARQVGGGVEIAVADDGPGLPFDPPEAAFSSFSRAGTVDFGTMTGSGIGLTVAKRLTELQRGRISVESSPEGCRFAIWLPIDRPAALTRVEPGPA